MSRVFWRDMLLAGTLVNVVATFAALIIASQGGSGLASAIIHFAPIPLNLWLLVSVWRARGGGPITSAIALIWFVTMTLV